MEVRKDFMLALDAGVYSVSELCRGYGVSRKTAYKWLHRWEQDKDNGLADRSRAPHTCPHATPSDVAEAIIQVRREHPTWGPRKVVEVLGRGGEFTDRLPAASTAGDILRRAGLVPKRRYRRRVQPAARPRLPASAPNDLWCADFKGEFLTRNGKWCFPLTVTDACSRYLLECQALPSTAHLGAKEALERLFHEIGLPRAIRTDNGTPFGSRAICGLSRLSIWWMKLGIIHDPIDPGRPGQNGRHERMHRTLKAETARPPAANSIGQQQRFDAFRSEYNYVRPHEGIGMLTPAQLWTAPTTQMPLSLPKPAYEGHMQVRKVSKSGEFIFRSKIRFLSEVLAGELVALEEIDDGIWSIVFYRTELGRLAEGANRIIPAGRNNRPEV